MDELTINSIYNKDYYDRYGHNKQPYMTNISVMSILNRLAETACRKFNFKTHLDVGCAGGHLVSAMRSLGKESYGIDVSKYIIENVSAKARPYVSVCNLLDLPISEEPSYDFVTCVEVVEHMEAKDEDTALDILCSLSDLIYFSSADDPDEPTHINIHEQSYWRERFLDRGFINAEFGFPMIPWGDFYIKAKSYSQLKNLLDSRTRGIVLLRDNFSCVLCGKKGVQVHEILPRSAFGKRTMHKCYMEKNRASLCPSCHEVAHTKQERSRLIKVMQVKYEYKYQEQEYQKYGDFNT